MNKAIAFLDNKGVLADVIEVKQAKSALEAAQVLKVELKQIAKSLTFRTNDRPMLILMSGDTKVDSNKFVRMFKIKSKMLDQEEVFKITGYLIGGVCPFALDETNIDIYLDKSLQRNKIIYPGAGDSEHLVKIELKKLEEIVQYVSYIDIGKIYE
jgi:prolyl-tRNA editing enzyme YbaK/EbsC (Cys-tRNA(Pro) deacylase)